MQKRKKKGKRRSKHCRKLPIISDGGENLGICNWVLDKLSPMFLQVIVVWHDSHFLYTAVFTLVLLKGFSFISLTGSLLHFRGFRVYTVEYFNSMQHLPEHFFRFLHTVRWKLKNSYKLFVHLLNRTPLAFMSRRN